ncbi:hypothetical protein ACH4PU_30220 [Streptomyces sp. NPDC021100]|uniref:DNA polymerase III subunit beta family protein n=1 Tax=Streptomyces sp. NPDC021100 TaxID=3365114 RepID=UPI00378E5899
MSQVATKVDNEKTTKSEKPTAHFTAPHAELTAAMNIAEFGVPVGPNSGIQEGVLVESTRNHVTLSTFDFWTATEVTLPADTPVAKGRSLLDFAELRKAIAAVAAGETKTAAARIQVSLAGDLLSTPDMAVPVTTHDLQAFVLPPEPVPAIVTVDARTLLAQLERVLPCAGRDDTLPALTGVQVTLDGTTLALSATDRYRLAVAEVPAQATAQPPERPLTTLMPGDTLRRLAKRLKTVDGPVGIGIIEETPSAVARATLAVGSATVTMRPLEGRLPGYETLIPTEAETSLNADRAVLVRAVKKAAALIKAKGFTGCPLVLHWGDDGTLTLAPRIGDPADQDRVRGMEIPATHRHGEPGHLRGCLLALNPALLLDALGTFNSDTVTLHLQPAQDCQITKPVLLTAGDAIKGDGYRHLLMPVRLDLSK